MISDESARLLRTALSAIGILYDVPDAEYACLVEATDALDIPPISEVVQHIRDQFGDEELDRAEIGRLAEAEWMAALRKLYAGAAESIGLDREVGEALFNYAVVLGLLLEHGDNKKEKDGYSR